MTATSTPLHASSASVVATTPAGWGRGEARAGAGGISVREVGEIENERTQVGMGPHTEVDGDTSSSRGSSQWHQGRGEGSTQQQSSWGLVVWVLLAGGASPCSRG
jgi:hypothetical protein